MADFTDQSQEETQDGPSRATTALAIAIPVTLSGKDAKGVEFTEKTRTVVVSRHGGKIASKRDLNLGSEMTVHNPIVGQTARVMVVWVGDKRAADELREVSVHLLVSENIWGIDFPSYERQESGLQASRLEIRSTQGVETAGEDIARLFQGKAEELSRSGSPSKPTNLPETAKNFEESNSSVWEWVKRLEGDLQACRTEIGHLVAELEGLKHAVNGEMGKTSSQVQESRAMLVEPRVSALEMKVKKEIESVGPELMGLTQKRLQEEVAPALEPLIQRALERVSCAAEEQSVKAGEGMQGLFSRLIQEGQAQLTHMLQSTTSKFQQEIHHISGTALASAQTVIVQALSKSAVGFEAQLQNTVDVVAEAAAKQLQNQAEDTLLLLGEELKTSSNKVTAEMEERLSSAGRSVLDAVSSAAHSTLEELQVQLSKRAATLATDCTKRLEESLAKAEGEQQRSARSGFQIALEQECAEALARMKSDLAQALQDATEQAARQASALKELRKEVGEESLQTLANVQVAATQAIGEVSDQIELQAKAMKELCGEVLAESSRLAEQYMKSTEIEQSWLERIRGKQQQAADEIVEAAATRLGKQLEENLDLFGEKLKLKQEEAASGTAEAFRSKLAEMLSAFHSRLSSFTP
jgi:hypothetical protein